MVKCPSEDGRGPKIRSSRLLFFCFFNFIFNSCCSNSMKMEDMLRIENIGENTLVPLFLINLKINMLDFVSSHKVVEGMYF